MACPVEDEDNKVWRFEVDNGNTGEMTIVDPLIDNEDIARERATSEFIKNAYASNYFSWATYRTDLYFNDVVKIEGLSYFIKGISCSIDSSTMITTYLVKRYD